MVTVYTSHLIYLALHKTFTVSIEIRIYPLASKHLPSVHEAVVALSCPSDMVGHTDLFDC